MDKYKLVLKRVGNLVANSDSALDLGIVPILEELVDLHTPMKVIDDTDNRRVYRKITRCPRCKKEIFLTYIRGVKEDKILNYCPHENCGQSLDWSK